MKNIFVLLTSLLVFSCAPAKISTPAWLTIPLAEGEGGRKNGDVIAVFDDRAFIYSNKNLTAINLLTAQKTLVYSGVLLDVCPDLAHQKIYAIDFESQVFEFDSLGKKKLLGKLSKAGECRVLDDTLYVFGKSLFVSVRLHKPFAVHDYSLNKSPLLVGRSNVFFYEPFLEEGVLLVRASRGEFEDDAWILLDSKIFARKSQWFTAYAAHPTYYSAQQHAFYVGNNAVDTPGELHFYKANAKSLSVQPVVFSQTLSRPNCKPDKNPSNFFPTMTDFMRPYGRAEHFAIQKQDSCGEYLELFDWFGQSKEFLRGRIAGHFVVYIREGKTWILNLKTNTEFVTSINSDVWVARVQLGETLGFVNNRDMLFYNLPNKKVVAENVPFFIEDRLHVFENKKVLVLFYYNRILVWRVN